MSWQALWHTKYSFGMIPAGINWVKDSVCKALDKDGEELAFKPQGIADTWTNPPVTEFSDDPNDPPVYWNNIDKFVATQTAIWEKMDAKRKELLAEITSKAYEGTVQHRNDLYHHLGAPGITAWGFGIAIYPNGDPQPDHSHVPGPVTMGTCKYTEFPLAFSKPELHVTPCGVFLVRYCIAKADVVKHSSDMYLDTKKEILSQGWYNWYIDAALSSRGYPTDADSYGRLRGSLGQLQAEANGYITWPYYDSSITTTGAAGIDGSVYWSAEPGSGKWPGGNVLGCYRTTNARLTQDKRINHRILVTNPQAGVFAVDVASMVLKGWKNGETGQYVGVTPGSTCEPPPLLGPENPPSPTINGPTTKPKPEEQPSETSSPPPPGAPEPDTGSPPSMPPNWPDSLNQNPIASFPGDPSDGTICGTAYNPITLPPEYGGVVNWPEQNVTIPGSAWLMQLGSPTPKYPTQYGAYCFDLLLRKWGRQNGAFQVYIDYQPVNTADNVNIPYNSFLIHSGVVLQSGKVALFDDSPTESEIVYGKIGYYRLGTTDMEEVHVHFASDSTGYVVLEPSYNGHGVEITGAVQQEFTDASQVALLATMSARWYNITVKGKYDFRYIEFRGHRAGRR